MDDHRKVRFVGPRSAAPRVRRIGPHHPAPGADHLPGDEGL